MLLRKKLNLTVTFVALAAALAGCPSVDDANAPTIAVARFDTTNSVIPLPNDLALQRAPALPDAAGVQKELLGSFIAANGFPSDQEVSITIPVSVRTRNADSSYGAPTAPAGLNLDTVNDDTVAVFKTSAATPERLLRCTSATPTTACWQASYAPVPNQTYGNLTLRRLNPDGTRRWDADARYVVAVREGVETADGIALAADGPMLLIRSGEPLSPELQPPGFTAAQAAQLESLRATLVTQRLWAPVASAPTCAAAGLPAAPCWLPLAAANLPAGTPLPPAAFDVVEGAFPTDELLAIQTFKIQPAIARPLTDSGSGQIPLPSDFLLDPATGLVRNVPSFGPAAAGLATLDGFSTTAPLFVSLTAPAKATTVSRSTLRIYKIGTYGADGTLTPQAPAQLRDLTALAQAQTPQIVTQPPTTVVGGAASTLVLAPAVPVQLPPEQGGAFVPVPPLDEKSAYLVVVTNRVTDMADQPLRRSTLMDIVFSFNGPLYDASRPAGSRSLVPGAADADAAGLQALREKIGPVLDALSLRSCAAGAECAVVAYTVKTQSVKDVSKLLAAAPYGVEQDAAAAVFTPAAAADFDPATLGIPLAAFPNVQKFVSVTFPSLYAIQGTTGAFDPAFASWGAAEVQAHLQPVRALVAVPKCGAPPCVAPLVVFHHGLNGARYQLLTVANTLAAKGFVVAAIDAPYHGDRAYCAQNSDCVAAGGGEGVCTPDATLQTPSDATAPGRCAEGNTLKLNTSLSTQASGNFFITSNFFRIRDGIRQDQLDQSALVLALARPPAQAGYPQPPANPFAASLAAVGVGVNPTQVYYAGLSLGGIVGTSVVATNPRFSRAGLNVPGATLVDVFTSSPTFQPRLVPIFQGLGIDLCKAIAGFPNCPAGSAVDPAVAARYGQTLAIAKWILDPADPLNYAANVATKTYDPGLQPFVAGGLGSATTAAYGQMVVGDQVITNPYNRLLLSLATPGAFSIYTVNGAPPEALHGIIAQNFTSPLAPLGEVVRQDLADFLAGGTALNGPKTIP